MGKKKAMILLVFLENQKVEAPELGHPQTAISKAPRMTQHLRKLLIDDGTRVINICFLQVLGMNMMPGKTTQMMYAKMLKETPSSSDSKYSKARIAVNAQQWHVLYRS